ncbi:DNA repair protein RecN (Recombination protein N) [Desulfotomaculum arcticum]|uniref:DNA repair protein RecN n=1 Tax=Desulfotruncus arcticus DSM 17038 TaxID=1121424 RepID=A0A1I2MQV4_9FIRM|nr:DNA repair protein RecN [Desulfotruncus arcticus]SFF93832.1 DNA repair protein RecN (Recombination protein N) [Desulfotomaculum arcticum] [Desulfotruncus arcticus DSM 17038]
MLIALYIQDFGLIDSAEIEFSGGLNVLTGETGAGKSVILDALKASLGFRIQSDMIRTGRERAVVQSLFDINSLSGVLARLEEYGLQPDAADDLMLALSREINRQGRNICRINGRIVNLSVFREIGGLLADLHGQHDQQSLLQNDKQVLLLDGFGGYDLEVLVKETARTYREWQNNIKRKDDIIGGSRERQQRRDTIKYQLEEIEAAKLAGEDENQLNRRRNLLANAEKIGLLTEGILKKIHSGDGMSQAVVDLLGNSQTELEELVRYLPDTASIFENIQTALCLVEDAARELSSYRENIEMDPRELNYLEERLSQIERLKKKYGDTIEDIVQYRNSLAAELEQLDELDIDATGIEKLVETSQNSYFATANKMEKLREKVAERLKKEVEAELSELEMAGVQFDIGFFPGAPGPGGINKIEFMISPNPGEPLKPLAKIASGGELSRVMLALKSILAGNDDLATLVFDEVDAGIGGRTLRSVAEKLDKLALKKQVLCVTHSAVIAAYASTHYLIEKLVGDKKTTTTIKRLDDDERINELSRMLGGDSTSENLIEFVKKIRKKESGVRSQESE